jgi:hypothetical protein
MEVSANVRRTEPTPRREQDGETYSAATRSRSTSTQPIAAPSTATHTSCSRIARATRSAAPRVAHLSPRSLDIAGTASARMARRRILASASSSAASARRICIRSPPRGLTPRLSGRRSRAAPARCWAATRAAIRHLPRSSRSERGRTRDAGRPRQSFNHVICSHAPAPRHSITSPARARIDGGIVRPSVLAVLRLMTSWYLEACSTGSSAGLAPLRILSM